MLVDWQKRWQTQKMPLISGGRSWDIAWEENEPDPNVHTAYFDCYTCHEAFMLAWQEGRGQEVRPYLAPGSYVEPIDAGESD